MIREIVLDTETTGLSPAGGDRLVEIGCVELINHIPSGQHHHIYINPERAMPEEAFKVHGLGDDFLADKPVFKTVAGAFLDFIGTGTLIIHNAPFDMGFLNAELEWAGLPPLTNAVIDTVMLARQKHPGARVSLDALCKHYGIDNARRTLHGALLDSEILAEVYLELIGGKQVSLALAAEFGTAETGAGAPRLPAPPRPAALPTRISAAEAAAHTRFVEKLGDTAIWAQYGEETAG